MPSPPDIRRALARGATAAFRSDRVALEETASWLASATVREFLAADSCAREFRYDGPVLGRPREWTRKVLANPSPAVAALASMHRDGYVRERAVRVLAAVGGAVSDRALAVRVSDHVEVVRELAARAVVRRTALADADQVVPLLRRIEQRSRGGGVLGTYLHALVTEHGAAPVWARLRDCADRDTRRAAFRHSLTAGLLGLPDAIALLANEKDQIVRRRLVEVIAATAAPEVVAAVLLRGRSAESRALALVKLTAADLDPADVERLLVDRSVLVRLWARRRWQEMGHEPAPVYAALARSAAAPTVRARAYTGLAETATTIDRREILDLVRGTELALRTVGLSLLRGAATAEDVALLLRLMADEHARVARLAGEVLVAGPQVWSPTDLAPLKAAADPELRRRAWWVHRNRGGWDAVVADLELLHDANPRLAMLARQREPVLPMYLRPDDAQRRRITDLLATAPLDRTRRLSIAFAAGLSLPGT